MKTITITIRDDQWDWMDKKKLNKSQYIQAFLDEQINTDKEIDNLLKKEEAKNESHGEQS